MTDRIDIKGINKNALLRALYDHAKPLGMGLLHYDPAPMTEGEAEKILARLALDPAELAHLDYVKGRVMKVCIMGNDMSPAMYDRDNGAGAVARIVARLRGVGTR